MNPYARNLPAPAIIGFLALGLLLAIGMGVMTGMQNMRVIFGVCGATVALAVVLYLKTRVWLLIPICWALTGRVLVLPLPFTVRDLSVMLVFIAFLILIALKMVRMSVKIGWIDGIIGVNLAWIFVVYLRNPVGIAAMGSDMVGGRPYFNIGMAFIAFLILSRVIIEIKEARLLLEGTVDLEINESWSQGWKFRVNEGSWSPVERSARNTMVAEIPLRAGEDGLRFAMKYRPPWQPLYRVVMTTTALFLLVFMCWRKKNPLPA